MWKRLDDIEEKLNQLRDKGVERGNSIGWNFDDLPFSVMLGRTTYIGAAPASGKTEWWFEILINLSCKYGWNHIIYSPETGSAEEIYSELCYKFIGKPFVKSNGREMNEKERIKAMYFVNKHFVVIDPVDEDLTIDAFYDLCDKISLETNTTYHTTTIDPWNELTENFIPSDLGREDKYLSRILGIVRKNARKTNRHNCLITHVRDQSPITNKDGKTFFPMPTAREFAGGQVWFRKGLNMIIIWRPPYGLVDETGHLYENNEVHINIAKAKPKGTAKRGVYRMYLDLDRYQYYMVNLRGEKVYADRQQYTFQHEIKHIEKVDFTKIAYNGSNDFFIDKSQQSDDCPF